MRCEPPTDTATGESARLLLDGLRALIRTQQISERANVECCGMTLAQSATLHVLFLDGPLRPGALSRRLGIAPSTLTRNLERIEERGWVERVADPGDGRSFRLRLSRAGRRQARAIEDQNQQSAVRLLEELSPSRRERVLGGLMDLLEAIDRIAGPQAPEQFKPLRDFLEGRGREARGDSHDEE